MLIAFRQLGLSIAELPASAAVDQFVVFGLGSLAWAALRRDNPGHLGITFVTFRPSLRLAARAFGVVGPALMVFLLVQLVGSSTHEWLGASLLTATFLLVLPVVVRVTAAMPTRDGTSGDTVALVLAFGIVAALVVTVGLARTAVPMLALACYFVVVGFSEEVAFRGVLQSLLNKALGRPYEWRGIRFGPGLFIAALLFGLAHTLVASDFRLQVALFTTAMGLILGFVREKDGSVMAPVLLHAFTDLPRIFFARFS